MPETKAQNLPRWSLDSVFPGFDSAAYADAKKRLGELARAVTAHMEAAPEAAAAGTVAGAPAATACAAATVKDNEAAFRDWLAKALELENEADILSRTLSSYCYAIYSTNTADKRAMAEINAVDEIALPFARAGTLFLNALAANERLVLAAAGVPSAANAAASPADPRISPFAFYLEDALFWQQKQMSPAEEDLAADLARSGADAWGRLQEQVTSTADCLWDETTGERKTLVQLRALAYDADRSVREKAYRKELEVCRAAALPVAAALNGIKGTSISLNGRRHWAGENTNDASSFDLSPALEKSVAQGRLTPRALAALISAMEESRPHWRRYLKAKARLMGIPNCAFYDLFAPVGSSAGSYTWDDVKDRVIACFSGFSARMGDFARRAFESGWIDAEPRNGKVSGAYCTDMPLVKETRVLCNFDGAFNSVSTVAHELGHAFHSDLLKDVPALQQDYPMTLAETASIFAETLAFEAEIAKASPAERLGLLEIHLQDGCQILVDILSRFYFEQSVFADRKSAELTPDELCAKMTDAQMRTYGDGLDPDLLHPYMWLVKCHYYSSDLAFYNFPYAFGQLFGMALYARYRKEGPAFARKYEDILLETGRMDAVSLTRKAGFDIESPDFWRSGIALFIEQIDEFERLVDARASLAGGRKAGAQQ